MRSGGTKHCGYFFRALRNKATMGVRRLPQVKKVYFRCFLYSFFDSNDHGEKETKPRIRHVANDKFNT